MGANEMKEVSNFTNCDVKSVKYPCDFSSMFSTDTVNVFVHNSGEKGRHLIKLTVDHSFYDLVNINNAPISSESFCEFNEVQGTFCY